MRALSETTRTLLKDLWSLAYGGSAELDRPRRVEDLLKSIGASGEPAAVPGIYELLFQESYWLAQAAGNATNQLVACCTAIEIAQLDKIIRGTAGWRTYGSTSLPLSQVSVGAAGVLSCSGNGYVREAAVRYLAHEYLGMELPFLLLRINDWVPEVRSVAIAAVRSRIVAEYSRQFVRCLPLLESLERQSRHDGDEVFQSIRKILTAPDCFLFLREAILGSDRQVRRAAMSVVMDAPPCNTSTQIMEDALGSADGTVRLMALRGLCRGLGEAKLCGILEIALRDKLPPVRACALTEIAERFPNVATPHLTAGILDRHTSIRSIARFYLRRCGVEEFAPVYRRELGQQQGAALAFVIAGLGETGDKEDSQRVAGYLSHPTPSVRRAAISALGRLDAAGFQIAFFEALLDRSPSVANTARNVIVARRIVVSAEQIRVHLQLAEHEHSRQILLSLSAKLSWWDSAPLLITFAASTKPALRRIALKLLKWWRGDTHRLSSPLTLQQLRLLETEFKRHGSSLDQETFRDLAGVVGFAETNLL